MPLPRPPTLTLDGRAVAAGHPRVRETLSRPLLPTDLDGCIHFTEGDGARSEW